MKEEEWSHGISDLGSLGRYATIRELHGDVYVVCTHLINEMRGSKGGTLLAVFACNVGAIHIRCERHNVLGRVQYSVLTAS
jgi:hypothetical protein